MDITVKEFDQVTKILDDKFDEIQLGLIHEFGDEAHDFGDAEDMKALILNACAPHRSYTHYDLFVHLSRASAIGIEIIAAYVTTMWCDEFLK